MRSQARNVAYYWIGRQNIHSLDLQSKWDKKKLPDFITEPLLQELIEEGLINDDRYLRNFIEYQLQERAGEQAVRFKLARKGIHYETIDSYMEELWEEETVDKNIEFLALKQARKALKLEPRKQLPNIVSFLARRGYPGGKSYSAARAALEAAKEEAEAL